MLHICLCFQEKKIKFGHFFNAAHRLEGESIDTLLTQKPSALGDMMNNRQEGLFTLPLEDKGVELFSQKEDETQPLEISKS